jgi:succinoglycan biosynthesis transport protein ExoP
MSSDRKDQPLQQLLEYWRMIVQNKWWVFFPTLALALASVVYITFLPNQYEATTTILVDPQQVSDQYVNPAVKGALTDRLQTISQEVLSSTRLQEIIDQYHLYPGMEHSMGREQLIEYMRKAITIEVKHAAGNGPGSFTITYQGSDPTVVAKVANELAGRFISWNLQSAEQVAETTTEFLGGQLNDAKTSLVGQEQTVRNFKMSHLGQMPDNLPANLGTLAQLRAAYQGNNDALNRLEQERFELKRLPAPATPNPQITEGSSERARLEAEKSRLEAQVTELRLRYTPTFPEVVDATDRLQRVKAALKALPPDPAAQDKDPNMSPTAVRLELIDREATRLTAEQEKLSAQIAAYQAKVDASPLREQQLTDLTRDYEISKEQYRNLLAKKYSAAMASDLQRMQKGERFTILDPARPPQRPVKPKRATLMAGAALASLMFSIVLVIGKEKLDPSIKAEKEVEDLLPGSVALLAAIPTIITPADKRRRLRYAIFALTTALLACLLVAGLLWRVHPIL